MSKNFILTGTSVIDGLGILRRLDICILSFFSASSCFGITIIIILRFDFLSLVKKAFSLLKNFCVRVL